MKGSRSKLPAVTILAEKALKKAVREAIKDHARTGDPIAIWRNGKVVQIPARSALRRSSSKRKK